MFRQVYRSNSCAEVLRLKWLLAGAVVACCVLAIAPPAAAQPSGYDGYQIVHIEIADDAELRALQELQVLGRDFQVWSEVAAIGRVEVRVAPQAQPALAASGLRFEVVTADLQRYLDALFAGTDRDAFFDSLRTYDEHVQFMNDLAAAHPDLAEVVDMGSSVQGRTMWALRITGSGHVKPGVLYHGAEHGNEQATSSVVARVAHHLLTNYDTDPEIAALVDHVEWFLMPIMNPDGYVAYDRWNAHGIDLNRNWGGPGSGQDPSGGPWAFSEPESSAVRNFLLANPHVRVHIDLHGYVPWIMWAWAHIPDPCPDHERFYEVGVEFRDRIAAAGGGVYDIGSIYDVVFYSISGCSTNYTFGELGLWAFGIEVNHANMPAICEEFLSSMLYVGQWIRQTDCNGNGVDDLFDVSFGGSSDDNGNGVPDECEPCMADLDGDLTVGAADLALLLGAWGPNPAHPTDLDGNDVVDAGDLALLLGNWGPC